MLSYFPGGLGAYSDSRGSEGVRKEIAEFITKRDGYPSDPNVRSFLCTPQNPLSLLMQPMHLAGLCNVPSASACTASMDCFVHGRLADMLGLSRHT